MASASFLTKSLPHRAITCLPRTPTSSHTRRRFASPRCGPADQAPVNLLTAAQERAGRRAIESSREEPLFHDPYAACLADVEQPVVDAGGDGVGYYELATRFIDEELMEAVASGGDAPLRQVVLLTDGMDTRPYRLPWPSATTVFDVSPSATHNVAVERLEAVGARIRRGCMLRHVSVELSEDGDWTDESWERNLVSVGYHGTRPSIWAMQGLQTLTAEGLKVILRCVSTLAMKDSVFLGELRCSAISDNPQDISAELSRVFGSNGFHVSLVLHKEISSSACSKNRPLTEMNDQDLGVELLFVAKQLRLSDHQVDDLMRMISDREEIDEDGFEDW
ncbi:hypothetical protein KC19_3G225500 [Ceratodon purpureus]|uniref:S-adenosyl-L-methionine-dependent methyltransferase n=1 Tax=Ceratodon purpureus TaxID=3225 RepID=A0A8T0IP79_CERPU|nr:hypothetical protein KC19_3G225500 [Ceratodon purpureus]